MKASVFYRVAAVILLLFAEDTHLGFASQSPNGALTRFLAQCGPFTLACKGSAGRIGTSFLRPDFPSACFFYSRRYLPGS